MIYVYLKFKTELSLGGKVYNKPARCNANSSLFGFAVDTNSEGHGVEPSDDADGGDLLPVATDNVAEETAITTVEAAAAVELSARAWLSKVQEEHNNVPWFVDLVDLSAARLGFVEVLLTVDSFVAHLKLIIN